jgi:hypothetical protein
MGDNFIWNTTDFTKHQCFLNREVKSSSEVIQKCNAYTFYTLSFFKFENCLKAKDANEFQELIIKQNIDPRLFSMIGVQYTHTPIILLQDKESSFIEFDIFVATTFDQNCVIFDDCEVSCREKKEHPEHRKEFARSFEYKPSGIS